MHGPCWVPGCENEARQKLLVFNTDKSEGVWAPVCFECDSDSVPTFMLMWTAGEPHTPICVPARFEPLSGRYVPLAAADHVYRARHTDDTPFPGEDGDDG